MTVYIINKTYIYIYEPHINTSRLPGVFTTITYKDSKFLELLDIYSSYTSRKSDEYKVFLIV